MRTERATGLTGWVDGHCVGVALCLSLGGGERRWMLCNINSIGDSSDRVNGKVGGWLTCSPLDGRETEPEHDGCIMSSSFAVTLDVGLT